MNRFEDCLSVVFKWEGAYSNHPKDTGGATKFGVTQETLSNWRGKKVSIADVQNLTLLEAKDIFKTKYWTPVNGDALFPGLDLIVFDAAVNHGVTVATEMLQRAAGIKVDGNIGPETLRAIKLSEKADIIERVATFRKERYVTRPNFATFGQGWFNRLDDVTNIANASYTSEKWVSGNPLDYIVPDVDDFLSNETLQKLLKSVDYYKDDIDGLFGNKSVAAMSNFLMKEVGATQAKWSLARRKILLGQVFAKRYGYYNGSLDGLTGPLSKEAFEKLNYKLATTKELPAWRDEIKPVIVVNNPVRSTVWPLEKDVPKFFGEAGKNLVRLELPYKMKLAWDKSTTVSSFLCNQKVQGPLRSIFEKVLSAYGQDKISELGLDLFAGCYNDRNKVGGTSKSMHAYGIAVDIDSERNQLKWNHTLAYLARPEYEIFWKIVENEGAVSLGRVKDFDWMHFQFARV